MTFKPYYLGCLAHASYLLGGSNGEAAVIDPRRDVEEYLADAEAAGLTIRCVIETHLHADFVSGHVELARRTGATIFISEKANATFPHHPVREGDTIALGDTTLRFLETPGHTPEGVSALVSMRGENAPRMVFTGDTLFIGDVGRPDLAGSRGFTPEDMARALYHSLAEKLLTLPDSVEVWPAHGAGSACGRAMSEERVSTIGRERAFNPALRFVAHGDEAGFIRYATEGLPIAPAYFSHDAQQNRQGAPTVEEILSRARPMEPAEVESRLEDGTLVLDTRSVAAFGAGHAPGAVHIQLEGKFAPWVGSILPPDADIIVIAEPEQVTEAITRLARVGYERILGWLDGGMEAWRKAGGELALVPQINAERLKALRDKGTAPPILDVRTEDEREAGQLPEAIGIPLAELQARIDEVPNGPLLVICGSGYRSSIACSLLQRAGRQSLSNLTGGWDAWAETEKTAHVAA